MYLKYLIILSFILSTSISVKAETLKRPPQFVLISFDGSKSHNFWRETLNLAEEVHGQFSYFISGVYFLTQKDRTYYTPPKRKAGASDIGFAVNDLTDIEKRTEFIWKALHSYQEPMDIGSHVNGHFDGGLWTQSEWKLEFSEFHKLVEKVFTLYPSINATYAYQWESTLHEAITGFRAPLLAQNLGTQQVLKEFGYTYDASQMLKNKWPNLMNTGVWNIGLSRITLAGTKKETVAMDYNILYGQCNGKFNPKNAGECATISPELLEHFQKQTYKSYINTFLNSYYGNRSPLSIGHHFSLWNKGTYWKALQKVILNVCTLPEVKCITHKSLVNWLNTSIAQNGNKYLGKLNQGEFDKSNIPQEPRNKFSNDADLFEKVALSPTLRIPEISTNTEKIMLKGDLTHAHENEDNDVDLAPFKVKRSNP